MTLIIYKATPSQVEWSMGGSTIKSDRFAIRLALTACALGNEEMALYGVLGDLDESSLQALKAEMDAAHDVLVEKARDRVADFDSNFS